MKRVDLAYIAGIFDGEGCIQIAKRTEGKKHHYLRASLSLANEYIPNLFKFHFGGAIYKRDLRSRGWQIQWSWSVHSRQAGEFLEVILPYLKLKRNEAELALEFLKTIHPMGKKLSDEEYAIREAQRILMSEMKIKQ